MRISRDVLAQRRHHFIQVVARRPWVMPNSADTFVKNHGEAKVILEMPKAKLSIAEQIEHMKIA